MANAELVGELDRNMDAAFSGLLVLNLAMSALVKSLPEQSAARFIQHLDVSLDHIAGSDNPPALVHQLTLNGWRNLAAHTAGFPPRDAPK
ncbi:MAG: hypothetical protein PHU46_12060 [Rhodocyclaceae bacterium]|nr:hypothetical protein [Rhodocyclaceae bacterium]